MVVVTVQTPVTHEFVSHHPAWFSERLDPETLVSDLEAVVNGTAVATALEAEHVSGSTEPWIQDVICALLHSLQRPNAVVLECGGFLGHTSARLAATLQRLGGGDLIVAEYDLEAPERADAVQATLERTPCGCVRWTVRREDACSVIRSLADESVDFAFLDDDHTHTHVDEELRLLLPKMRVGGLIVGHDVFGSCALHEEFERYGGYALDLPRLGAAGGLGILQVR